VVGSGEVLLRQPYPFLQQPPGQIFKGILSRDEYFLGYNYKQVLSVRALIVFTIFCFLVDEKSNSKFQLAPLKLLTNFENDTSKLLKRP
jgi:hypothetical protein